MKLIIAEKPSVGRDIAQIVGATDKKDGYIEGSEYIVTWGIGHLVNLKDPEDYDESFKNWKMEDLPLFFYEQGLSKRRHKVNLKTSKQYNVVKSLINRVDIDLIINAGDSGREGYLIQKRIYTMCGNTHPEKVLWTSSYTKEAVLKALNNLHEDSEFKLIGDEATSRAEIDQMMGINLTRALTIKGGSGVLLVYGRCQTPLLNLLNIREEQIRNFKPVPFYEIECEFNSEKGKYKGVLVNSEKEALRFAKKEEANSMLCKIQDKGLIVDSQKEEKKKKAPLLYDIGAIQAEAGSKYGYTAENTLQILQELYEKHKILSYPRTDSRYLSSDLKPSLHINLEKCNFGEFAPYIAKIKENGWAIDEQYFNDKKVVDHPALIPTTENIEDKYKNLSKDEKRLFDMVVKSFIAIYYPPCVYENTFLLTETGEKMYFMSKGKKILEDGYREVLQGQGEKEEKVEKDESEVPYLPIKTVVDVVAPNVLDKETKCPKRFTAGTIIVLMEKYGIGTAATRGAIIEKLREREYINLVKGKYEVTPLGANFINALPDEIKSPTLTKDIEAKLKMISNGNLRKDDFLKEMDNQIRVLIQRIASGELALKGMKEKKESQNAICKCPLCKEGHIMLRKSEKGSFYGCNKYKDGCKFFLNTIFIGRKMSSKDVEKLCLATKEGKKQLFKGFKSKAGNEFEAFIKWDTDKKAFVLDFPPKK